MRGILARIPLTACHLVSFSAFWARRYPFGCRPVVVGLHAELGELSAVLVDRLGLLERGREVDVTESRFGTS